MSLVLTDNMKKIVLGLTVSFTIGPHGYRNTGRAASRAYRRRTMGDYGFGIQEVRGSNLQGTPFLGVSVSNEIG